MVILILLSYATWLSLENTAAPKRLSLIARYLRWKGKKAINALFAQLETTPSKFVLDQIEEFAQNPQLSQIIASSIAQTLLNWDGAEPMTTRMIEIIGKCKLEVDSETELLECILLDNPEFAPSILNRLILLDFTRTLAIIREAAPYVSSVLIKTMIAGPSNLSQVANLESIIRSEPSVSVRGLLIHTCATSDCAPQVDKDRMLIGAVRNDDDFAIVLTCACFLWDRGFQPAFWLSHVIEGAVTNKRKRLFMYANMRIFQRLGTNALPVLFEIMQSQYSSVDARNLAITLVQDQFEKVLVSGGIEPYALQITAWSDQILNSFELASERASRLLGWLLGQSRAIDPIISLITKGANNKGLKYAASIFSLMCRINPDYAMPRLIGHAYQGDPNVRRIVMMSLVNFPSAEVDLLAERLLFDRVNFVRLPAAYHLRNHFVLRQHALLTLRLGMTHAHPPTAELARYLFRLATFGR
jgi:hypothetical protein